MEVRLSKEEIISFTYNGLTVTDNGRELKVFSQGSRMPICYVGYFQDNRLKIKDKDLGVLTCGHLTIEVCADYLAIGILDTFIKFPYPL